MALVIKICGLTTAQALESALEAGADWVGFVFFPPSPRTVWTAAAGLLARPAAGRARKVAVMVDPDDGLVEEVVDALHPDVLQLHGSESAQRLTVLRARFGLPVIKALPVGHAGDLAKVAAYMTIADHLLFDARPPRDATRPGGLGKPFDWSLLAKLHADIRFFLSGGLDAGNVAEAIAATRPFGVDVSSSVEGAPGVKDPAKVRTFVHAARTAARATTERESHPASSKAISTSL